MLVSLPIISLLFLWLIFYGKNGGLRRSLLSAVILWGVLLTAFTEFLSVFRYLNFTALLGLWTLTSIVLGLICFTKNKTKHFDDIELKKKYFKLPPFILYSLVFIVATVGLIALIAPPNTGDAMAYHMSRVVHWIQNQSVFHYPSHVRRQLYQNPWSEFAIMHFQILSGGDRFANLVQWFSMVGSILGVSLIAKELGADFRGQMFSGAICATIPMGILQASSVKNSYVLSFWIVCFVYYLLVAVQRKANWNFFNLFKLGASLGLAILTKGTAYIYAFPFFIWLLISATKKFRYNFWKPIRTVAIIYLSINLGHYLRNFDLYGSPLGTDGHSYKNEVFGISTLFSNLIRNISLHLATPIEAANLIVEKIVKFLHVIFSLDVSDSRTTWSLLEYNLSRASFDEIFAGNPFHLLIIMISIYLFFRHKYFRESKYASTYFLSVISTFLLFCFLLKWQPWHSRLHLPFFVLSSSFSGLVLSKIYNRKLANSIAVFMILLSLPWVFCNAFRPILPMPYIASLLTSTRMEHNHIASIFTTPRIEQYFNNRLLLKETYSEAVNFLNYKRCFELGLYYKDEDVWEYPLWVLLQKNEKNKVKIKHVKVGNTSKSKSGKHPAENFTPCAIIVVYDNDDKPIKEIITEEGNYQKEWSLDLVDILTKNSRRAD